MKKVLLTAALFGLALPAFAGQGWVCYQAEGKKEVKVQIFGDKKTRQPSVMIVSNTTHKVGNRTIVSFHKEDKTLKRTRAKVGSKWFETISGKVDKRRKEVRDGEDLPNPKGVGAKIGNVKMLALTLGWTKKDAKHGTRRVGALAVTKRSESAGKNFVLKMNCYRYNRAPKAQ